MSPKSIVKPLLVMTALLSLAACGPKLVISDDGRVPGAGPRAELVRLINLQRKEAGLAPLRADAKLGRAATDHAGAMARNACVEFDCGGREVKARLSAAGYRARSSKFYVSAGRPTPEAMIREMMATSWSRKLILDPDLQHVAAGYGATGSLYRHYWAIGFAAPAFGDRNALVAEIVRLTNIERVKRGAPPLTLNRKLNKSAQFHADFMTKHDCMAHRCPNGPDLGRRALDAGYAWRTVAENIAGGQQSPAQVVAGWMDSPGHRANILNPQLREIGVGYAFLDRDAGKAVYRHYWVQNFGLR